MDLLKLNSTAMYKKYFTQEIGSTVLAHIWSALYETDDELFDIITFISLNILIRKPLKIWVIWSTSLVLVMTQASSIVYQLQLFNNERNSQVHALLSKNR